MATTPAIININPNRELRKDQWKEMALQQQSHIGLLMKRLEMEKDMYSKMYTEKLEVEEELQEFKNYYDSMLADILRLKSELAAAQDEAYKAGRAKGYEDAEAEFRPYEKQRELDALREDYENYVDTHDVTTADYETIRGELEEIKENMFPCDVYWSANNGDITLHKIPNEIACLNTLSGDNAILEAFQNGFFGEEWGSYSSLSVVEMTREELADLGGLVERKEETESESEEEPETPKSTKDLVIDQLNEEPHAPAFEPLHEDATHQVVRGHFNVEFVWKVPAGINLRDTETYEFGDKWGVLYIENMKTGEKWDIEEKDEEDDFKRAYDLEVEDRDDDENTC